MAKNDSWHGHLRFKSWSSLT